MSAIEDAKKHLDKAREFLSAADLNKDAKLYDAAISNAATSGVNSKDAICLRLTGRTGKSTRHEDAVGELEAAGHSARKGSLTASLANELSALLQVKNKAQYDAVSHDHNHAEEAIRHAQTLLDGARTIVL